MLKEFDTLSLHESPRQSIRPFGCPATNDGAPENTAESLLQPVTLLPRGPSLNHLLQLLSASYRRQISELDDDVFREPIEKLGHRTAIPQFLIFRQDGGGL